MWKKWGQLDPKLGGTDHKWNRSPEKRKLRSGWSFREERCGRGQTGCLLRPFLFRPRLPPDCLSQQPLHAVRWGDVTKYYLTEWERKENSQHLGRAAKNLSLRSLRVLSFLPVWSKQAQWPWEPQVGNGRATRWKVSGSLNHHPNGSHSLVRTLILFFMYSFFYKFLDFKIIKCLQVQFHYLIFLLVVVHDALFPYKRVCARGFCSALFYFTVTFIFLCLFETLSVGIF